MFESRATGSCPGSSANRHFTKPPGFYVAVVLCSLPFRRFRHRALLPGCRRAARGDALRAAVRRTFPARTLGRRAGLAAAGLMLPASLLWLDKATSAEIDMMQVLWITASILCLVRAIDDGDPRWWLPAMLSVAAGFLTKWTAPQFFYFFAIPYLVCRGRLRDLVRVPHLASLAIAIVVSGIWIALAVARTSRDAFLATVMQESLPRFLPTHYEPRLSR